MKLTVTTSAASNTTTSRTTTTSRLPIAWKISRPMPGSANTFSTTMVPASRLANCSPMMVTTGIRALRSTCRQSVARWLNPLARAVRT